jgi:asparagine synthase (glutamine-hydrolysing)
MCGIAGFWQTKRQAEIPAEVLRRMGDALKHRGPDDSGVFYDDSTGLGMVHRRLSILDLSPAGHQPMASHSGRYLIIFNGEIYNFEEIRKELGPGHAWRGHSDTEVMLEAFERWGVEDAVKRFVGMFAFALWDHNERKLYLVRDRLGIKPLYYGWVEGQFVFASELKAIRQYPGFQAQIDRDVLALYMRHNYVPTPHCIYQGVSKLNAGCILVLSSPQEQPVVSQYWSATEVAKEGLRSPTDGSEKEIIEQLERKLVDAVKLRMIADVPLGAFLSGGIDSSTVVALMQSQSTRPVKTFTIGFHEDAYNEANHAKKIATHLGTDHTELYVTPQEALNVVPLLPAMYDEPFADVSQIPTYLVSRLARQSVTVSLSGDGGDELFGGYGRYFLMKRIWNSMRPFPKPIRKAVSRMVASVSPKTIDSMYRLASPLVPRNKRSFPMGDKAHKLAGLLGAESQERVYMHSLTHWDNPSAVVNGAVEPNTVRQFVQDARWLPSMEEIMMLTDTVHYLPDDILTKVDRASMAVSLEARVPILDHRVVEFAWKLPMRFKIRDGKGKWALRQVLYKYVPAAMIERPKMGFGVPIDSWLRAELREWAEDLLSIESLERHGLFNIEAIRIKWQEHKSGSRNWQYLLWDVLVFQDWMAHNVGALQMA